MIVQLSIEKLSSGVYRAHCTGEPWEPQTHSSIADCLREYGAAIPPEMAKFVNIEYGGCHLETTAVADLESRADDLSNRLMHLLAGLHAAA